MGDGPEAKRRTEMAAGHHDEAANFEKLERLGTLEAKEFGAEMSDDAVVPQLVESIPINVMLPCAIFLRFRGKYIVFRQRGDRLTSRRTLELQQCGVSLLYIHKDAWTIFLGALESVALPEPITPENASAHLRSLIIAYGQELERRDKEMRKPVFDKIEQLSSSLTHLLEKTPALGHALLRHSSEPTVYFMHHLVNTALYTNLIGQKLRLSKTDLELLTRATVLHDVGNLFLSKPMLYKRADYTPDEVEEVRTHPKRGAELLVSMGQPAAVVATALQHHEKMDGTGYPQGLKGEKIHLFARLCSIADVFDALTSHRPYRAALPPAAALQTMAKMKGHFDPNVLAVAAEIK